MTATTRAQPRALDWTLWVPVSTAPFVCFLIDFGTGLETASAALLCLAGIGIGGLALARKHHRSVVGAVAVGSMWLVGGLTLAVGAVFTLVGSLLLLPYSLLWGLLSCTFPWTGLVYLKETHGLTRHQAAMHGRLKIGLAALSGALIAASLVIAAHAVDSRFVSGRVSALNKDGGAETWQAALQSLNDYPLCLRRRCQRQVCAHLFKQFPSLPRKRFVVWPNVPVQMNSAFEQTFGASVRESCSRYR